jgi:hypothetical protein
MLRSPQENDMHIRGSILFLSGILFSLAVEAAPASLGLRSSTLQFDCGGGISDSRTSSRVTHTAACDRFDEAGNMSSAIAEAYLDSAEVVVQTRTAGAFAAFATSTLSMELRVDTVVTPPVETPLVDLGAFTDGEVALFETSFGSVRASLNGPGHPDTTLALGPPDFVNRRVSAAVEPDQVYQIVLRAHCQSAGGGSCVAALDPIVFFDQAAFDARLGAATYRLADYFVLQISPVPEPASGLLIAFGIAALGLRQAIRRRHRVTGYTRRSAG